MLGLLVRWTAVGFSTWFGNGSVVYRSNKIVQDMYSVEKTKDCGPGNRLTGQ